MDTELTRIAKLPSEDHGDMHEDIDEKDKLKKASTKKSVKSAATTSKYSAIDKKPATHSNQIKYPGFMYCLPSSLKWFEDILKVWFQLEEREVNVYSELFAGVVQFLSCSYVLVVIPGLLVKAGYPVNNAYLMSSIICCVGSLISGFVDNIPFIIAPSTSGTILHTVFLRQRGMSFQVGNQAIVVSGCLLIILGYRPFSRLFARLVPGCIQASISVGIGLLTSLAGCLESELVVRGKYTIVAAGDTTPLSLITMFGVVLIALCLHFHVKGAFSVALILCSIAYWATYNSWPTAITADPHLDVYRPFDLPFSDLAVQLVLNLIFLHACSLNGVARAFGDLAGITSASGVVPRGRWLYIITGVMNIFSGFCGGPPVLLCPESGAGIKAGARTGLSTIFCGVFFGISAFFVPLFTSIPYAGTAPLLIAIGTVLFVNCNKVDWTDYKYAYPAYVTLFFIPFTYSILRGAIYGWIMYLILTLFSGDLYKNIKELKVHYTPTLPWGAYFEKSYVLAHIYHNTIQLDDDQVNEHEFHSFISWPHYGSEKGSDFIKRFFPKSVYLGTSSPSENQQLAASDVEEAFSHTGVDDTEGGAATEDCGDVEHPMHNSSKL